MRQLIVTLGMLALLSSCQQRSVLPDDEAEMFARKVDDSVENALVGLSEADYQQHTRNFDEELLDRVNTVSFPLIVDEIIGRLGSYQSHKMVEVVDQGTLRTVVYEARFENDPAVRVRVSFRRGDAGHHITGIWFDSLLLAEE